MCSAVVQSGARVGSTPPSTLKLKSPLGWRGATMWRGARWAIPMCQFLSHIPWEHLACGEVVEGAWYLAGRLSNAI